MRQSRKCSSITGVFDTVLVNGQPSQSTDAAAPNYVTVAYTPTNIQVQRQSRIGSPRDRHVPPRDVDGATLFVARSGHEVREFLFVDTEQAYQAADVALLAQHLVRNPVDQAFDHRRRLFLIVNEDGSLATIAIYRNADIAAWSLQETAGRVLSITVVGDQTMLLVDRPAGVQIERLDDLLMVDAGVRLSQSPQGVVWTGLDHLEGQIVALIADGLVLERIPVTFGAARVGGQDPVYRPVRVSLRLFETRALHIDTGDGLHDVPLHTIGGGPKDRSPDPFTGDRALRALGWRRGAEQPPWRIEQDTLLPCALLSATTEVKVN